MTRLIDADKLEEKKWPVVDDNYTLGYNDAIDAIMENEPEVTPEEKPQSEWFDCLPKGLLKARHGDYVVYKVDYLLDHLTREVFNMEGARRMKPVTEDDNEQ